MPVTQHPGSEYSAHATGKSDGVVRWQPLSCLDFFCEIHSPDAEVLERARLLFCTCGESTPASTNHPILRWRVTQLEAPDNQRARRWQVSNMDSKNLDSDSIRSFKNPQRALTFIEYSVVQSLVDHVKNHDSAALFAIHGALLCKDDFAIVIVGPGEAGKSTLSCALWQNGWSLLSDDFCFVRDCNQAFPAARRVSLRNGSRDLLGEEIWARIQKAPSSAPTDEGWIFHPHQVDTKSEVGATRDERRAPVRVAALIFLGRLGSGMAAAQMQRHDPARAALSLLPYCTLLERPESAGDATNKSLDWGAALARIAPVAARVPVYDLGRGALPEMVSVIESLRASL